MIDLENGTNFLLSANCLTFSLSKEIRRNKKEKEEMLF
jgi:hypothetical protein